MPGMAFGQKFEIKGTVKGLGKEGIPYATITLKNKDRGFITDEKGNFQLSVTNNDTVFVSSPGFKSSTIYIKNLQVISPIFVRLLPQRNTFTDTTEAVRTFQKSSMTGIYNVHSGDSHRSAIGQCIALKIDNPTKKEAFLGDIYAKFDKKSIAQTQLRIRVFSIDPTTGYPANDLLEENVIVTVNSKNFSFNVEKYKISVPAEGCFIGFDWIEMPIMLKKLPLIYDQHEQMAFLRPFLKTTLKVCNAKTFARVFASEWSDWKPLSGQCPSNALIAATLKY